MVHEKQFQSKADNFFFFLMPKINEHKNYYEFPRKEIMYRSILPVYAKENCRSCSEVPLHYSLQ